MDILRALQTIKDIINYDVIPTDDIIENIKDDLMNCKKIHVNMVHEIGGIDDYVEVMDSDEDSIIFDTKNIIDKIDEAWNSLLWDTIKISDLDIEKEIEKDKSVLYEVCDTFYNILGIVSDNDHLVPLSVIFDDPRVKIWFE